MTDLIDALFRGSERERLHSASQTPPTLSVKDGVGILTFEALTMTTHEAGKQMPSRFRWKGKELHFEVNDATLAHVRRHWPKTIFLQSTRKYERKVAPVDLRNLGWKMRKEPFAHQRTALDLSANAIAFAYLMDMGTGKSKVFIDNAAYLFGKGEIDRVLVVAPAGVHEQWIDQQLAEHWPHELPFRSDAYRAGKRPPEWWGNWTQDVNICKWLTINIDLMKVVRDGRGWKLDALGEQLRDFLEAGRSLMGVDESQKIKSPSAQRTRSCTILGRSAAYRRILTGSPVAKGLEDYYAQFRFLDPQIIGVHSMAGFKRQFCHMGGFGGKHIIGYQNTEEFHRRIAAFSYRVEKSDVLDLPPKIYQEWPVEKTREQRRVYDELRRELMTLLSDGTTLTVEEAVQRMLRLQQVTQGFLPREDGGFDEFPTNRIAALDEIIESASGKIVVWCRFRRDIDSIMAHLGEIAVRYDGEVGSDDRKKNVAAFMDAESGVRVFVANAAAGGAGLNLAGLADTVVYYSNSFSSLDRWQSEDRTHRIGTKGTVNYYDIVCRGTMDRAILANLRRKRDISTMSLTELKQIVGEEE